MAAVILLAVLAAIGWGASDFLGGLSRGRVLVFSVLLVSELAGGAMIVPALLATGAPHWSPRLLLACVAGVGVTVELGVVYYALSVGAAFITAPVGAIGTALAVGVGLAGGDPLTPVVAAGLVCAVIGGGLCAAGDGGAQKGAGAQIGRARAAAACVLAAAGVAAMQISLHGAGKVDPYWAAEIEHLTTAAAAGLVVVALCLRRRVAGSGPDPDADALLPSVRQLPLLGLVALTGAGGDVAYAAASSGSLSTVSALASLYPIPTIALAAAVQRRRAGSVQWLGIALALAGAALLGAFSP